MQKFFHRKIWPYEVLFVTLHSEKYYGMKPKLNIIHIAAWLVLLCTSPAKADDYAFRMLNASNGLADNSAQLVTCTKTGRMVIATLGNINFYDGAGFSHADVRLEDQYQLLAYHGNYHFYFDRRHHLWLKNTNTVTCLDLLQERFIQNVDSVFQTLGCHDQVDDMFVDSLGNVWLLTEYGLYGVEQQQTYQVLRERNLQDLDVFGNTLLLFYDNGEEVGLDLKTKRVAHRTRPYGWEEAERYEKSSAILRYKDGYFQIRNGADESLLMYFDAKKHEWNILMRLPYHLNNMALKGEVLFMASSYGYWTYDIPTGHTNHVETLLMKDGRRLETDVNTLSFDRQGGLWLGTEKRGLLYAHPRKSPIHVLTWDNPQALAYAQKMDALEQTVTEYNGLYANCMYTDSRGWTWYGTTKGLFLLRTLKTEPKHFTRKEGLLNEVVYSVVEDKHHNIWLATAYGITCIIFKDGEPYFVTNFGPADDVPAEAFVNAKSICLDDGTVVMQAIDHVVAFHPDSFSVLNPHPEKLYPKLIRLLVNGNYVQPGVEEDGNVIIDRAYTRVRDISLNSNQNSLSMTFSALNFFRPLQTYYRIRVKGLIDDWQVLSYFDSDGKVDQYGLLHLPLVGLQPGDYEVEVQAAMYPDMWDGTPFVWMIHVNQPWWQTTGLLVILGLILLALLVANFVFYSKNTKMRARRASEEGDVIRKIRAFVERVNAYNGEMLSPLKDEMYTGKNESDEELSPQFLQLMEKILPYVQQNQNRELTMRQLCEVSGMDVVQLYEIVTGNLYKSPRGLVLSIRLKKAAEMLRTTQTSVEQIARDCGFYSPNYFIGNFFHEYKTTPTEFRREKS